MVGVVGLEVGVEVQMDWHKELERSLGGQGDSSLYDPAQYSAQLLQVKTRTLEQLAKVRATRRLTLV